MVASPSLEYRRFLRVVACKETNINGFCRFVEGWEGACRRGDNGLVHPGCKVRLAVCSIVWFMSGGGEHRAVISISAREKFVIAGDSNWLACGGGRK